ncbi:hypothetical protein D3C87_2033760 [compost metagenome]
MFWLTAKETEALIAISKMKKQMILKAFIKNIPISSMSFSRVKMPPISMTNMLEEEMT